MGNCLSDPAEPPPRTKKAGNKNGSTGERNQKRTKLLPDTRPGESKVRVRCEDRREHLCFRSSDPDASQ